MEDNKNAEDEIKDEIKSKFGFNLKNMDLKSIVNPTSIAEGIKELILKEVAKYKSVIHLTTVIGELGTERKLLSKKQKVNIKFQTIYHDGEKFKITEKKSLRHYTNLDLMSGGMISRLFIDIITNSSITHNVPKEEIQIFFQIEQNDELKVKLIRNKQPKNIVEEISIEEIFSVLN